MPPVPPVPGRMLAPSFHDQVDRDATLTGQGQKVGALDRAPCAGQILYRELDRPALVRIPPALCMIGPVQPAHRSLQRGAYGSDQPAPLAARCGELLVVGHGVLLLDRRTRLNSTDHFVELPRSDPAFLTKFKEHLGPRFTYDDAGHPRVDLAGLAERAVAGRTLVLAQPGHGVFGHWLAEILPRLILARRLGLAEGRFLLPSPFPPALMPWLAAYGVTPERIAWFEAGKEIARLEDAAICSRLNRDVAYVPLANSVFREMRQHLVATPPTQPRRRIFLSRQAWQQRSRQLANHDEVAAHLARHGFEQVQPEALSPIEAAHLMSEASHVVAEDGSACLLMIYAAQSARLLVLQSNSRLNLLNHTVAQALNQRVGIVLGSTTQAPAGDGVSYRIDPADLEEGLAALLQSRAVSTPARSWWKDLVVRGGKEAVLSYRPERPTLPACYDRISWMPERAVRAPLTRPARGDEILALEFAGQCDVSPRQPFCALGPGEAMQALQASWPVGPCLAYRASDVSVLGMGLLLDGAGQLLLRNDSRNCGVSSATRRARQLRAWLGPLLRDAAEPLPDLGSLPVEPQVIDGTTLLLAQPGQRIFGQWLVELLPRLWTARRLGLAFDQVLLAAHLPPGMEEALAWIGLEARQVVRYQPQRHRPICRDLLVLDCLFDEHAFHPDAAAFYDQFTADAAQDARPDRPQRLYLSRRRWHRPGRRLANRDQLAPLLASAGFLEIHPETLPLREQIALAAGARMIVADEGSAAYLAAFAPAGAGLLLLAPEGTRNPRHGAIAQLRDLRYGWVMGERQDNPAGGEPNYRVAPDLLVEGLRLLRA